MKLKLLIAVAALTIWLPALAGSPTCPNPEGPGYYFDTCGTLVSPHHPKPQCDQPPLPCQEEGYAEKQKQLELDYDRQLREQYQTLLGGSPDLSGLGSCAENGSCYGDMNEFGVPKTVHVEGYYRSDGTYVQGHYRGKPRK